MARNIVLLTLCFVLPIIGILLINRALKKSKPDLESAVMVWAVRIRIVLLAAIIFAMIGYSVSIVDIRNELNTMEAPNGKIITMEKVTIDGEENYRGYFYSDDGTLCTLYTGDITGYHQDDYYQMLNLLLDEIVIIVVLLIAFSIMSNIIKMKTPFTDKIAKKLQLIGQIVFLSGFFLQTVSFLILFPFGFHSGNFFRIDLTRILLSSLVYLCGVIFEYGSKLQKTEDELL